MSLGRVLSRLGKISNSIYSYERLAIGLTATFPAASHSFLSPCSYGNHESRISIIPLTTHSNKRQDSLLDLGGLRPARFALQEFNKFKKVQLHLVRVLKCVRVDNADDPDSCICWYGLLFEAVNAAGVLKYYQASVKLHDLTEGLWLEDFCLVKFNRYTGEIRRARLYHHLDNFYEGAYCTTVNVDAIDEEDV